MPTPPLCPAGSREALYGVHRSNTSGNFHSSHSPFIRGLDLLLNKPYKFLSNAEETFMHGTITLTSLLVSPDGDYVMGFTHGSTLQYAYRADNGVSLSLPLSPASTPSDASTNCFKMRPRLSPDKQHVYLPQASGTALCFYKVPEMSLVAGLPAQAVSVQGNGVWSQDGTKFARVISVSPFLSLRTWPALGALTVNATGSVSSAQDCAFNADGTRIAVACRADNASGVYNVSTGRRTTSLAVPSCERVELTPDGLYWMFGNLATGLATFVDPTTNAVVTDVGISGPGVSCHDIRFSSDGKYLLFISPGDVYVYDWATKTLKLATNLLVGGNPIYSADVGPAGRAISNSAALPVRDVAGNPISGVTVRAFSRDVPYPRIQGAATTDENGKYLIPFANNKPKTLVFSGASPSEPSISLDWVVPE